MDGKGRTARRVAKLLKSLMDGEVHGRSSAAQLLEVNKAAAYVNLRALADELPAVEQVQARGGFRFNFAKAQPVSAPVAIAASIGRTLANLLGDGHHARLLRDATDDIIKRCHASTEFEHIDRKMVFMSRGGDPSVVRDGGMLNDILDGVLAAKKVKIRYQSRDQDGPTPRLIWPLSLIIYDHQFYVLALRDGTPPPRVYRMSRVSDVAVLDEHFPYPSDERFDPRRMFEHVLGIHLSDAPVEDIVVKLDSEWAKVALTHRWHDSQQIREIPGGVEVRWRLRRTEELESLVLGFGSAVEVMAPGWLRERVAAEARLMAARNGA